MGVQGLWELLRPAALRTSLAALGRDAFLANRNGLRAFVIGVDASIWIFHAQATDRGSNPFERTLFYKISHLLQHPILPVFVFDGPNKPAAKRNKSVTGMFGTYDEHSRKFKKLLDACGLEYWNAPGEAEAELALMNRQGKIDAVLSDDVDALLFGATCVLRNNSPSLSGTTNGNSNRIEMRHYEMYRASEIFKQWTKEGSSLMSEEDCRHAMVLIALLSGGDYAPEGVVAGLGPTLAMGLSHAGVSNFLKLYMSDRSRFHSRRPDIHSFMVDELRNNNSGFMGRKNGEKSKKLNEKLPSEVFDDTLLEAYLNPACSPDDPALGWQGFGRGADRDKHGRWNLETCAQMCERFFEWATREAVCKKFASDNGIFCSEVMNEARLRILKEDKRSRRKSSLARLSINSNAITHFYEDSEFRRASLPAVKGVPDHLLKVHSTRPSPMCEEMTEFRLAFNPTPYVNRCRTAMEGYRKDQALLSPEERVARGLVPLGSATDTAIKDEIRTWIPDYLIRAAWPSLAEEYDKKVAAKAAGKATPKKKATAKKGKGVTTENPDAFKSYFAKGKASQQPAPRETSTSASSLSPPPPTPTPRTRKSPSVSKTPSRRIRKANAEPLFLPASDDSDSPPSTPVRATSVAPAVSPSRPRGGPKAKAPTLESGPTRSPTLFVHDISSVPQAWNNSHVSDEHAPLSLRSADGLGVTQSRAPSSSAVEQDGPLMVTSPEPVSSLVTSRTRARRSKASATKMGDRPMSTPRFVSEVASFAPISQTSPPDGVEAMPRWRSSSVAKGAVSRVSTPPSSPDIIAIDTPPSFSSRRARVAAEPSDKRTRSNVSSTLTRASTPASSRPTRKKTRTVMAKAGTADDPIDFCDSSDDGGTAGLPIRAMLWDVPKSAHPAESASPASVISTPTPLLQSSSADSASPMKGPPKKLATTALAKSSSSASSRKASVEAVSAAAFESVMQSTLDALIVARRGRATINAKPKPEVPPTAPPAPKPDYTYMVDKDGVEHIYLGDTRGKWP